MTVFSRDRPLPLIMIVACFLSPPSLPIVNSHFAIAQSLPTLPLIALPPQIVISEGTRLPLRSLDYSKILIAKNEIVPLTLTLSTPLRDNKGLIVIPQGSLIAGELRPINKGSQFFARKLTIFSDAQSLREYPLQATSGIILRTELVTTNTSTTLLAKNTLISRAAACLIAEITGDRTLVSEVTPPDQGIGLLAGWFLKGTKAELIAINPNRDLTLTLNSNLILNPALSHALTRSPTLTATR